MRKPLATVKSRIAMVAAAVAVGIAPVSAHAATPVPVRVPVGSVPVAGGQTLAPAVIPDTCPELKRQLSALAKQGHRSAGCITPVPASAAPAAGVPSAARVGVASIGVPSWCTAGSWWGTRTELCQGGAKTSLNWYDTSNGKWLGTAQFLILQDVLLNPLGRTFAENFDLKVTSVTGQLPGATLNLAVRCGGTCTATSYFPNGSAIIQGSDITTSIVYNDSTATVNKTNSTYALSWGPSTTTPSTWTSPSYRCDNLISGQGAGCIVPDYIPTMTSMASLTNIAANIRTIQQAGPHHYGRSANGLPLSRNSSLQTANRNISCPSSRTSPTDMSCDEYPFASTDQGASRTTYPDWGWAWVPVTEQNSQGGLISGFFKQQRVLDGTNGTGDKFWVAV